MKRRTLVILSVVLTAAYILTLVPMLGISFYAHPAHDDYDYSDYVYHVLSSGNGSAGNILRAVFQKVRDVYSGWQGTFSAVFLMALQPGVFSQEMYFITTFVMLGMLTLGTFVFSYALTKRVLKQNGWFSVPVAAVILILSVQFAPDVHQGFFWWNGSVLYIFFYGLSLVYFALMISLFTSESGCGRWICAFCLAVSAILIGGSNYTTALLTCEITCLAAAAAFIAKHRNRFFVLGVFAVLLCAFAVSVFAPGNAERALNYEGKGMNPVRAIAYSVVYGCWFALKWTRLTVIAYLIAFTPMFVFLAKKSAFRYRYPLIVISLGVLLFASQFTPSFYAMGFSGPERQRNIYHNAYMWLVTFSWFYLIGWAVKRGVKLTVFEKIAKRKAVLTAFVSVLVCLGCVIYGIGNLPMVSASVSIISGEAEDYDKRYNRMLSEIYASDSVCVTEGMDKAPKVLSPIDLSQDKDFWVNNQMERYFGLEEIRHK